MTNEPPDLPSEGDAPTYFEGKPGDPSSAPSLPSDEKPTFFDDEARRLLDPGTELPPDLAAEHRAVYLRRGDLVANRFQVVKLLGFGGMGAVYHVKDRELHGQDRALKVMLPSLLRSDTARERFLSEVSISQQLAHPGIVRVHDLGLDSGRGFRFFTMEYVPGKTLNRVLKERGGKLPVDEALDITRQLCDALEYAHHQTVHRDLKPQNVMVQPDGRIKVLDFGLAKLMSPGRMTRSNMALGTAYYQAPEQTTQPSEVDKRADIYAIGAILYELLTGRLPYGATKPPSALDPSLPEALDRIAMRCIDPEAEGRFGDAADLRAALDSLAYSQEPRRGSPRNAGRGQQTGSRRVSFGLAAAVALTICVLLGILTYRFHRAQEERRLRELPTLEKASALLEAGEFDQVRAALGEKAYTKANEETRQELLRASERGLDLPLASQAAAHGNMKVVRDYARKYLGDAEFRELRAVAFANGRYVDIEDHFAGLSRGLVGNSDPFFERLNFVRGAHAHLEQFAHRRIALSGRMTTALAEEQPGYTTATMNAGLLHVSDIVLRFPGEFATREQLEAEGLVEGASVKIYGLLSEAQNARARNADAALGVSLGLTAPDIPGSMTIDPVDGWEVLDTDTTITAPTAVVQFSPL